MLYINDHSMFKSVNVEPYLCISLDCYFYRPQGKVMFSQASVSHSVHNRPHGFTRSLLILVTAQSTCILLECFLVVSAITIAKALCLLFYLLPLNIHIK